MADVIRILVVDDHAIVRNGIKALLAEFDEFEVVGEANNGEEAVAKAAGLKPDVVLMDLVMPVMDGIEATRRIVGQKLAGAVLALTSFATDDKVFPAVKAGALGYLLKDTSPEDLLSAIRLVHKGEPSLAPDIARKVLQELAGPPKDQEPTPDPLTPRELEVLQAVAQGHSNQAIAERLFISEATVRTHMTSILAKLQLANRVQAALYALKEGLATLPG